MICLDKLPWWTGASRGIGEAAARSFAKYGAKIVHSRRAPAADIDRIAAEINENGGQVKRLPSPATSPTTRDVEKAVRTYCLDALSDQLDILVNNAGVIEPISRIEDVRSRSLGQTVIDVNVKGVYQRDSRRRAADA